MKAIEYILSLFREEEKTQDELAVHRNPGGPIPAWGGELLLCLAGIAVLVYMAVKL